MIRTRITLILTLFGALVTSACRDKPTCFDCEDADDDDDIPVPDLPCGGANLMTDNLNCGACGYECALQYEGIEYEAGACNDGQCGPHWSDCLFGSSDGLSNNCSDICARFGSTCVANGCSGKTGMMTHVYFDELCRYFPPLATLTGGCDEPIPWMIPVEDQLRVSCCCHIN
jgi:hypothetical protein